MKIKDRLWKFPDWLDWKRTKLVIHSATNDQLKCDFATWFLKATVKVNVWHFSPIRLIRFICTSYLAIYLEQARLFSLFLNISAIKPLMVQIIAYYNQWSLLLSLPANVISGGGVGLVPCDESCTTYSKFSPWTTTTTIWGVCQWENFAPLPHYCYSSGLTATWC